MDLYNKFYMDSAKRKQKIPAEAGIVDILLRETLVLVVYKSVLGLTAG